jgi:hypothetical protein
MQNQPTNESKEPNMNINRNNVKAFVKISVDEDRALCYALGYFFDRFDKVFVANVDAPKWEDLVGIHGCRLAFTAADEEALIAAITAWKQTRRRPAQKAAATKLLKKIDGALDRAVDLQIRVAAIWAAE